MNTSQDIQTLIIRYFSHEATPEEIAVLEDWIKIADNRKVFKSYAKANRIWDDAVFSRPYTPNRTLSPFRTALKYAVAAACLIFGFYWLKQFNSTSPVNLAQTIAIAVQNHETLYADPAQVQTIALTNGEVIAENRMGTLVFNNQNRNYSITVSVPVKQKVALALADGSLIKLNANTSLQFNQAFNTGKQREVNLEGEAYFSVAKNPVRPFYVKTDNFTTKVLGTQFNINSYQQDNKKSVALYEGSIAVENRVTKQKQILKPGEALSFDVKNKKLAKKEVAQKEVELSWLKNEIYFEQDSVEEIIKKVEKYYGLKVYVDNRAFLAKQFTGKFREEKPDDIFKTISIALGCQYRINGNKVYLYETR